MKKILLSILAFAAIILAACNGSTKGGTDADTLQVDTETVAPVVAADTLANSEDDIEAPAAPEPPAAPEEPAKPKERDVKEEISQVPASSTTPDEGKASIVGKWIMLTHDKYNLNNENIYSDKPKNTWWEFTDKEIIFHEEASYDGMALEYFLVGKQMIVQELPFKYNVVQLTPTKLVLRSSEYDECINVFTFKR